MGRFWRGGPATWTHDALAAFPLVLAYMGLRRIMRRKKDETGVA